MEAMSSACQVPTQAMGLDTCMCSCGTPCFALTLSLHHPRQYLYWPQHSWGAYHGEPGSPMLSSLGTGMQLEAP